MDEVLKVALAAPLPPPILPEASAHSPVVADTDDARTH